MKRRDACDDRDSRFTYRSLHARACEREPGVCVTSVTSVTGSAPLLMAKQFSHSEKQQQCLHSMYIVRTKPESRGTNNDWQKQSHWTWVKAGNLRSRSNQPYSAGMTAFMRHWTGVRSITHLSVEATMA